ncbi:hypothetical protein BDN70DRAFT_927384 [Pholiota conissans]|uniref:Uncharacterized protein n=1 Tax=Pholiota conissans TaxID=109636 RepID=A0A9P5ZCA2_9AGAR|nr:hypothetical protein BDN70DRAFT_927384 [Pholiota conissans]
MVTANEAQFLLPINPTLSVPDKPPRIPSAAVMAILRKGAYVPLFHFTDRALSALNESTELGLSLEDKSASLPPSIRKPDAELDLNEFENATERMLALLPYANRPQEIINMYREFWANIQKHPFWKKNSFSYTPHINQKALLLYQDEQRRRWHMLCASTANSAVRYNLAIINETVLEQAKVVARQRKEAAEEKERDDAREAERQAMRQTMDKLTQDVMAYASPHHNQKRRRR